jgi:hypothetical protein
MTQDEYRERGYLGDNGAPGIERQVPDERQMDS